MTALALLGIPAVAGAATIKTNILGDEVEVNGNCSLREAMVSATGNIGYDECVRGQVAKRDVIKLLDAQYDLTIPSTDEDANLDGDLDYTGGGPLTIRGTRDGGSNINASQIDDRVIHATGDATSLRVEFAVLKGGNATGLSFNRGGNVLVREGSLDMKRGSFRGGIAPLGGGLSVVSGERLSMKGTTFFNNQAISGGGLYVLNSQTTVINAVFSQNEASGGSSRGGAITYAGEQPLMVRDSFFLENEAIGVGGSSALGGAIYGAPLDIARSYFGENRSMADAEEVTGGGAIDSSEQRIVNSTFFENESSSRGGAIRGAGVVAHSTFLANSAAVGGDHVAAFTNVGSSPLVLRNSILPGASILVDLCATGGTVSSRGYNVATYDDSGCGFTDRDLTAAGNAGLDSQPNLNGGRTFTLKIDKSSQAKNAVPKRACRIAGGEDQRGFGRPAGAACDAGAVERGARELR